MPKAHTFTALGMPLAPRGPPPRPLVRFAAPVLVPLCLHPSASSRPCSAKPTTALSHPLRCINLSVSTCSYAATPTIAVLRLLRCIRRSVSACFRAATPILVPSRSLRRPRASSALFSLVCSDCWAEAQSPFSIAKPLQGSQRGFAIEYYYSTRAWEVTRVFSCLLWRRIL